MKKLFKIILTVILFAAACCYEYILPLDVSEAAVPVRGQLEIKMLDVGHGDAVLLRTRASTILVDTGDYKHDEQLVARLKKLGIKRLDALILTHHHLDHIGGSLKILQNFQVEQLYDNGFANPQSEISKELTSRYRSGKLSRKILKDGQKVTLTEGLSLQVLAPLPQNSFSEKDLNNNSLVFKLQYGDFSMLFTGDIEAKAEHDLVKRYGKGLHSTVLKVAHHGSGTSSTYNFLTSVQPQLALISCGEQEKYNHPNKKILGTFSYLQIPVKVTSWQGEITLTTIGKGFEISTEK